MAAFHVAQVLETLIELDRELTAAGRFVDSVARMPVDRTISDLRAAISLASTKLTLLHERALDHASVEDPESHIARLRARTNVVLLGMNQCRVPRRQVDTFQNWKSPWDRVREHWQ